MTPKRASLAMESVRRSVMLGVGLTALAVAPASAWAATGSDQATQAFDAAVAAAKAAMMADPASAMKPVLLAEQLAKRLPDAKAVATGTATAEWLHGEALSRVNQPGQALPLLEQALKGAAAAEPRSKLVADVTLARGTAETAIGDVRASLADFQRAYELYVALGDGRGQAKALLSMGGIYSDAGDNQQSLRYYSQVPDVYRGDPAIELAAHNNLGETLKKLGRYRDAEKEYRKALVAASSLGSAMLQARILTNLASAQLLDGGIDGAKISIDRALAVASAGDAAGWRPFIWGVKAQIAAKEGNYQRASAYLDRTFAGINIATTTTSFRDFHETAYHVYQHLGRYELSLNHLEAFKRLDDEIQKLTASSSAALVTARFDFANQDLRIARLKAEKGRQEARLQQSKARFWTILFSTIMSAAAIVLGLLLAGFVSLSRSRNRVRAANAELSHANHSLQDALRAKTEFLATTSHEIRTPLNGILGMTQVLLADQKIDRSLRDKIEVVHGAGETMRALVDDILDVAKIETGNLVLQKADFDLGQLLREAERLWRGEAEAKKLTLELDIDAAPAWVNEDEDRLRQIVFNLMSNALKFTHEGGVCLRARTVTVDEVDQLVIEVADTGIGIAADKSELIFESFRQIDGGTSRQYGGTGLGLAICRNLSRAMGGDVTVASELGRGSCFTISLPLAAAVDRSVVVRAESPAATSLAMAKVVLVEANPLTQRIISNVLAPACEQVVAVASPAESCAAMVRQPCDHILVEAGSCGADPADAISALRSIIAAARGCNARVSILHGPAAPIAETDLLSLGPDQLLAKPIGAPDLLAELGKLYSERPLVVRSAADKAA